MIMVAAPRARGVTKIGKRHPGRKRLLVAARKCGQGLGRTGGHRKELHAILHRVVRRLRHPNRWSLGQHDVRVGAAEAERVDAHHERPFALAQAGQLGDDVEPRLVEMQRRIRRLDVQRRRQRALLGLLILRANELVRSEQLVEELWGDPPPPTAQCGKHVAGGAPEVSAQRGTSGATNGGGGPQAGPQAPLK